ncbi:MAG: HlyD family type I secretion periplasmic adaptor subunit [Campylobacterota bacterium]|nr:HlyD family type I secretion periplasmic adaptor subunit [Campylobacterota bacterium]
MNQANNKNSIQKHHDELEKTHHSSHLLGRITILLIFGIFGLWSIFAKIETTITANGKVITQSYNKIVMHPSGGIVKKVFIQEGDLVKKDQPLLKLDSIEYKSEHASNIKKFDTNLFSVCRLIAQAKLQENLDCSDYEKSVIDTNQMQKLKADAQALFDSSIKSLQAKIDLLKSQNDILRSQNNGLKNQIAINKKLLLSYQKELKKWKKLLKENAIDELKVVETQRQIEQSHLQIGSLESKIEENLATIQAHKKEMELEQEMFKNEALTKSNELELDNRFIHNKIISLQNTLHNLTIKAPSDGLVTDMKIHAAGEVVSPQKPIMSIVPDDKDLIIETYVLPTDIEKVYKEQKAEVSFPAFVDPSAMPIGGKVTYISADAITQEGEKESYYVVLVEITPEGFEAIKQNGFKIIPGMPSAVFINTGKKTLMEYLTNPIIQMFKGIYHAN